MGFKDLNFDFNFKHSNIKIRINRDLVCLTHSWLDRRNRLTSLFLRSSGALYSTPSNIFLNAAKRPPSAG